MLDIAKDNSGGTLSRAAHHASILMCALIGLFFIILYWYMTLTGEDISQFAASAHQSSIAILLDTYGYLPRIGELYHRLIIRYYEPIARLNLSLLPRLVDGILAVTFLYVLAWLALLRRPRLDPRSAMASGIIFAIMTLTPANAIFLSRFSCLHNYVLGYLITAAFCLPFARSFVTDAQDKGIGAAFGLFLLGFSTGYSTEVSPAILFLLLSCIILVRYKATRIFHPWMIAGLSGLVMGITLFYVTGGLNSRVGGSYATVYEYVWNRQNKSTGLGSMIRLLLSHLQFNARNLWPWLLFYAGALMTYFTRFKLSHARADRSEWSIRGTQTSVFLLYSLLYLGVSSVIRVDDELYGRYMAGVYLCIAITAAQFADALIFYMFRMKETQIVRLLSALAAFIALINADMFRAFNDYNMKSREIVRQLQTRPSISLHEPDLDMAGSALFNLRQYPILESWANPTAFGVNIQYIDDSQCGSAEATSEGVRSAR